MTILDNIKNELSSQTYDESYAVNFVDCILRGAMELSATDIHIECLADKVNVKMRIDGMLFPVGSAPVESKLNILTRLKYISKVAVYQSSVPQDGRITYERNGMKIDLRSSFLPTIFGEKAVIRFPEKEHLDYDINNLGIPESIKHSLIRIMNRRQGMILLTGPSSSGKTTTIYSILKYLYNQNGEVINISTIEDPVEQSLGFLNQTQVHKEQGMTYSRGLISILRQDPDIIMIGEIRDPETASISTQASLTGHLVISTIHSNQGVGVFLRLLHTGIEPFLIASAVQCALSQRLIRKLCRKCKIESPVQDKTSEMYNISKGAKIYSKNGCPECKHTGYAGRTGIFELIEMTNRLEDLILSKAPVSEFNEYLTSANINALHHDGLKKITDGISSLEELLRVLPANFSEDLK